MKFDLLKLNLAIAYEWSNSYTKKSKANIKRSHLRLGCRVSQD
ncbi:hypothetical protein [Nostoc sp.]